MRDGIDWAAVIKTTADNRLGGAGMIPSRDLSDCVKEVAAVVPESRHFFRQHRGADGDTYRAAVSERAALETARIDAIEAWFRKYEVGAVKGVDGVWRAPSEAAAKVTENV